MYRSYTSQHMTKENKAETCPSLVLEVGHLGASGLLGVPDGATTDQLHPETCRLNLLLETLEMDIETGTISIVELQIIGGQFGKDPIQDQLAISAHQSDLAIKSLNL
jgi:hypothetical protein